MDATAEIGRNLVSKYHIQPEYGDKQAEEGRDCRTRLARPNSQARTERQIFTIPVQLTTSRTVGNRTRLIHTLAICDDYTHIHTHILYIIYPTRNNTLSGVERRQYILKVQEARTLHTVGGTVVFE